jgi:hypothetical protein
MVERTRGVDGECEAIVLRLWKEEGCWGNFGKLAYPSLGGRVNTIAEGFLDAGEFEEIHELKSGEVM